MESNLERERARKVRVECGRGQKREVGVGGETQRKGSGEMEENRDEREIASKETETAGAEEKRVKDRTLGYTHN